MENKQTGLKIGGVVFHEPGSLELAPNVVVRSEKPGFVLVKEEQGKIRLFRGEPFQNTVAE